MAKPLPMSAVPSDHATDLSQLKQQYGRIQAKVGKLLPQPEKENTRLKQPFLLDELKKIILKELADGNF